MRCVVTGGSGFIGTHLVAELLRLGHDVLNIDIRAPKVKTQAQHWRNRNILDAAGLAADFSAFRPDAVIHLAARTDTLGKTLEDYRDNTEGTANVIASVIGTPTVLRLIVTSTQFVNQYHGIPRGDEDFAPHTIYGESKMIAEKATRAAGLTCTWTITRPTNTWGPWHPRYADEFWRILAKGLYLHPARLSVVRSYGYVGNVVFQTVKILEADPGRVSGKVFYLGDRPIPLSDWVDGFSVALTGRPAQRVPYWFMKLLATSGDLMGKLGITFPITGSRLESMTTSNDAPMDPVFDAFGEPPYSLQEGIEETVGWLREFCPGTFGDLPG